MDTRKKLDLWFWSSGTFSILDSIFGNTERSAAMMAIAFAALFTSYVVEEIEKLGGPRETTERRQHEERQ